LWWTRHKHQFGIEQTREGLVLAVLQNQDGLIQ
jgi:hypothetical protein